VGEIDIPKTGAVSYELILRDTGRIRGLLRKATRVELRRVTDDQLVAEQRGDQHLDFEFSPVEAGSYELRTATRCVPVMLTSGQHLDLGVLDLG